MPRRCVSAPPASVPASTCCKCLREGIASDDQAPRNNWGTSGHNPDRTVRFHCAAGHEWYANAEQALAQGRFLDQAGIRGVRTAPPMRSTPPKTTPALKPGEPSPLLVLTAELNELRIRLQYADDEKAAVALSQRISAVLHEMVELTKAPA